MRMSVTFINDRCCEDTIEREVEIPLVVNQEGFLESTTMQSVKRILTNLGNEITKAQGKLCNYRNFARYVVDSGCVEKAGGTFDFYPLADYL